MQTTIICGFVATDGRSLGFLTVNFKVFKPKI